MNERIQQLAEQAGIELPNNVAEGVNGPGVVSEQERLAKFAELIVKECADIAAKNQAENMNWDIAEIIKEHFGVEE